MKVLVGIIVICGMIGVLFGDAPASLTGKTSKDYPWVPFPDVNVQAQSYAGNSCIVQSYTYGDYAIYQIKGDSLVRNREYYRVYAWKGENWAGSNENEFTWIGNPVVRDVCLFAIGE